MHDCHDLCVSIRTKNLAEITRMIIFVYIWFVKTKQFPIPKRFIKPALIGMLVFACFGFTNKVLAINKVDSLNKELVKATGMKKTELLNELTKQLWNTDPDKALNYSLQAYDLALALNDSSQMALALKNTGIVHYFMGENDEAIDHYQRSLAIYSKLKDKKGISSCVNNLGLIYNDLGNYKTALQYYQQSLEIDKQMNDEEGEASTLNNIGEVYHLQGSYSKAVDYYRQSLLLEYKFKDYDGVAECLLNIGAAYQETENYAEGLKNYRFALMIFVKTGNQNRIALTLHDIARLYLSIEDYSKALYFGKNALLIRRKLDDKQGIASTSFLMSDIMEFYGDTAQADDYFFKAINLEIGLGNTLKVADILYDKGDDLEKRGEYEKAIPYFLNSMEFAHEVNARAVLDNCYQSLANDYNKLNDVKNSLLYSKKHSLLVDSLMKESEGLTPEGSTTDSLINAAKVDPDLLESQAVKTATSDNSYFYLVIIGWGITFVVLLVITYLLLKHRTTRSKILQELNRIKNQK